MRHHLTTSFLPSVQNLKSTILFRCVEICRHCKFKRLGCIHLKPCPYKCSQIFDPSQLIGKNHHQSST
uniref:Uncharacterized protein n=1 Tax=Cucumis melo TaxID=3656 RepID=A0A9I9EE49_CUCME